MEKESYISTEKNDKSASKQRHHREKIWQILFPIGIGVLLIIIAAVFVVLTASRSSGGGSSVSQWADTSTIWLVLPIMMFAVFGTLVLAGLIYLVARLLDILPTYTNLIQQYANLITARVNLATRKMVSPFVSAKSIRAGVGGFLSSLFGLNRK